MEQLLKVIALWGIADSVWMAIDPAGWSRFWGRFIGKAGEGGPLPRVLAVIQLAISLYLVLRTGKSRA